MRHVESRPTRCLCGPGRFDLPADLGEDARDDGRGGHLRLLRLEISSGMATCRRHLASRVWSVHFVAKGLGELAEHAVSRPSRRLTGTPRPLIVRSCGDKLDRVSCPTLAVRAESRSRQLWHTSHRQGGSRACFFPSVLDRFGLSPGVVPLVISPGGRSRLASVPRLPWSGKPVGPPHGRCLESDSPRNGPKANGRRGTEGRASGSQATTGRPRAATETTPASSSFRLGIGSQPTQSD